MCLFLINCSMLSRAHRRHFDLHYYLQLNPYNNHDRSRRWCKLRYIQTQRPARYLHNNCDLQYKGLVFQPLREVKDLIKIACSPGQYSSPAKETG